VSGLAALSPQPFSLAPGPALRREPVRLLLVGPGVVSAAQQINACASRLGTARAVRTAPHGEQALARLAEQPADLLVVDTSSVHPDCVHFTRRVLALHPHIAVVLVAADDPRIIAAALAAGARGVLHPGAVCDKLLVALARGLLTGHTSGPQPDAPAPKPVMAPLTPRERQVLEGIIEGHSNGEIGRRLYLSEDTIKTHARRLYRKLGVRDRAQAVAVAFRGGLVS
jgi:DNA-binding NarL/FixJ family response regulator